MLHIYPVALHIVREVRALADRIARFDRDHARQLRRSTLSMASNLGEGCGHVGGVQRARFFDALGSAREALVQLECADPSALL